MMKSHLFLVLMIMATSKWSVAQIVKSDKEEAAYTRVLTERSGKIVDQLHLDDPSKAKAITAILVDQYKGIGKIYDLREAQEKLVKEADLSDDGTALQSRLVKLAAQVELKKLHRSFIGKLEARLTPEQVSKIKDGMTYNVLSVTYNSYVAMIPSMTEEQKTKIIANLIEAREYAIDGGSSEEKHWWFGKYKGRINNYLSKEGYNLDQEREAWKKRREAKNKN